VAGAAVLPGDAVAVGSGEGLFERVQFGDFGFLSTAAEI
jgi:hypothetical protein